MSREDSKMKQELVKIERVAVELDVSIQTINTWYKFKRYNPDNEFAQLLPDYTQKGVRQTRYWKLSDIKYLRKFKDSIPHGNKGIMGKITHKKGELDEKNTNGC